MSAAPRWYVDTSAFVKLVVVEPGSTEMTALASGASFVASDLLRTESRRAVGDDDAALARIDALLLAVDLVAISGQICDAAGRLRIVGLRSLDALHLATAISIRDHIEGMVVYDLRLAEAAAAVGLVTISPGATAPSR